MSTITARTVDQLERLREQTAPEDVARLRLEDRELWTYIVDGSHREFLHEQERKGKAAALKPAPPPAPNGPGQFVTLGSLREVLEKAVLPAAGRAMKHHVSEKIAEAEAALSGRFASAEYVAAAMNRITELEARLAGYEKRAAAHDTGLAAHRKHLSNLEVKTNDLRRAMNGEPRGVERVEP